MYTDAQMDCSGEQTIAVFPKQTKEKWHHGIMIPERPQAFWIFPFSD